MRRLDSSSDLLQLGQAAMARAAFHGAHTSVWAAVMAEPKARALVRCVRGHDGCVAHHLLAASLATRGSQGVGDSWQGAETEVEML